MFAWIGSLPPHNAPTWIGLDETAEIARDKLIAESVVKKYGRVLNAMADE